jgi:hypothetical protein
LRAHEDDVSFSKKFGYELKFPFSFAHPDDYDSLKLVLLHLYNLAVYEVLSESHAKGGRPTRFLKGIGG